MTISRRAVRDFLKRPLYDSGVAKTASSRVIKSKLRKSKLKFTTKPRKTQAITLLVCWYRKSFLVFLGMGAGKTKISLDLIVNRLDRGHAKRALVLVPFKINIPEWIEQASEHAPGLDVRGLDMDGPEARDAALFEGGDVIVATYAGATKILTQSVPKATKKKPHLKGNRWVVDHGKVKRLAMGTDLLIMDECTAVKSGDSVTFRACRSFAKHTDYVIGLTGTPMDKDPEDLWSQFYLVDGGYALGETRGLFREAFCTEQQHEFTGHTMFEFDLRKASEVRRRMRHSSIRFTEEETQDLPKVVGGLKSKSGPMIRSVRFSAATWEWQDRLVKEFRSSESSFQVLEAVYMRMRQLASGYLETIDPMGKRHTLVFPDNPKLDALVSLLREMPDERVVVVHYFQKSGDVVADRLKKEKLDVTRIYGKTKDKKAALARWKASRTGVMVASHAIAYGINLHKHARRISFFETPDSLILRRQLEARVIRGGGMPGRRLIYDLVVKNSIEERILSDLVEGQRSFSNLVDGKPNKKMTKTRMRELVTMMADQMEAAR